MKNLKPKMKRKTIFIKSDMHFLSFIFALTMFFMYAASPGDNFFTRFGNAIELFLVFVTSDIIIGFFILLFIGWVTMWLNLRLARNIYRFIRDKN